jgi:hypothetical protein
VAEGVGEIMAKIYGGVEGIEKPEFSEPFDFKAYEKQTEDYVSKIKEYAKENGNCPEAGKEIYFGVADGRACYVVLSLKPVELIHLNIYDGYQFQYANRLTATDVRNEIKRNEALAKLFSR